MELVAGAVAIAGTADGAWSWLEIGVFGRLRGALAALATGDGSIAEVRSLTGAGPCSPGPEHGTPGAAADPPDTDPRIAVDRLYQRHARAVLGYLFSRLPSLPDAEDALADVFIAALRACAAGDKPDRTWLMTIARRRVADFYRTRPKVYSVPVIQDSSALAAPVGTASDPETAALRAEELRELAVLLARLPADQRDALALRFGAGLRSPQIAALMGRSDEAVRALISRAVRRLRKEWES